MTVFYDRFGQIRQPGPQDVMRPRRGVFGVISDGRGHVLVTVQKHAPEVPEFPGGGIDPGETPEQALIREIREETGLTAPAPLAVAAEYRQQIGFYADDAREFWDYSQIFWLLSLAPGPDMVWATPEDGVAQWVMPAFIENGLFCHTHKLGWNGWSAIWARMP